MQTLREINRGSFISSVLAAIYIEVPVINAFCVVEFGTLMTELYVISTILIISAGTLQGTIFKNKRTSLIIFTSLVLLSYYYITSLFYEPKVGAPYFFLQALFPFIIPSLLKIDWSTFLKTVIIVTIPCLFLASSIFQLDDNRDSIGMGASYTFLLPVIASIGYLIWRNRIDTGWTKRIFIILSIANCTILLPWLLLFGNRGPLLSIILFLMFAWATFYSEEAPHLRIIKVRFYIVSILIFLLFLFFVPLLNLLFDYLSSRGVEIYSIDKFLLLMDDGRGIGNGRDNITELTLKAIPESILWGHGVASAPRVIGYVYPHNFVLQLLLDGGLILSSIVLVPFVKGFVSWVKYCNNIEYLVILILLASIIPGAMVAGELWQNFNLWFIIGVFNALIIKPTSYERNDKK